jgi:DNA-binding SARP family transcriptional activator
MLHVLGPLEVSGSQSTCRIRGYKLAQVAGLLALRANQFVSIETLSEELWPRTPPRNATTTIRTHVYNLRRVLDSAAGGSPSPIALQTRPLGYFLSVADEFLDITSFNRLSDEGRSLLDSGRYAESSERLGKALSLWRGCALEGITTGPVLSGLLRHLTEKRSRTLELRVEADMRAGRHRDLVPELHGLVAADSLNEWMHARLMEALHRSGRRGAALQHYHHTRRHLDEALGIEPSDEMHRTYLTILTSSHQP